MKPWHDSTAAIPVFSGAAAMCWGHFYDWSHPIWLGLAWMFIGLSTRAFMLAMGRSSW